MGIGRVRMKTPDNAQKPPIIFPARKHSIQEEGVRWISHRKFLPLQKGEKEGKTRNCQNANTRRSQI